MTDDKQFTYLKAEATEGDVARSTEASPIDNSVHTEDDEVERSPSTQPMDSMNRVHHTRISSAWVAVAAAVLLGAALIDFILENTRSVRIDFFSVSGHIPVAVALLAAAVSGAAVVLAVGICRTAQLRLSMRRHQRADKAS